MDKELESSPGVSLGSVIAENKVQEITNTHDFPEGGFRAWSVACGAAGVLFCTFGYVNAFGVYQNYYQTHQLHNYSASAISWIGSIQVFLLFGGNLFGGPLFDRFGAKVIWPGAVLYIISVMMTSLCKEYWQLMLAQGILGGFCTGITMAPTMAATGQYFHKKRGAAMGIAVAGSSLGGVVFPIALSKLLYNHPELGFGWTVRILGFLMIAVLIPSCLAIRARLPPRKGRFLLLGAFKESQYVAILSSTFLMMIGLFTPIFYLPSYAIEHGMSTVLASYLPAILNGSSFFGRVFPGILADKVGRLNMLCAAGLSSGLLILCWQACHSNAGIIVFSVVFGFCSGAVVSSMTTAVAQVPSDPRNIGTYLGMGMATISFAALIGPPINGALAVHYHSFSQVSTFSGVMTVGGGIGMLFAKHASEKGVFGKI